MGDFSSLNNGRYRIIRQIGKGSMGVVYKAHDTALDRVVAVKTINSNFQTNLLGKHNFLEALQREAKIAGSLGHPNITAIHDIGNDQGIHFFIMEFVEGFTIESINSEKTMTLSLTERLKILATIAKTLHFAHMRSVVHRDIKPDNIMIQASKEPKIMDFGIARFQSGTVLNDPSKERLFGSPAYMSPEQIKEEKLDNRTDIFSLGVLAYEFLVFKRPFPSNVLQKLLLEILNSPPPAPSTVNPEIPVEIDKILEKALQKDKTKRFNSAGQFSDSIELLLNKMEHMAEGKHYNADVTSKSKVLAALKQNYFFFAGFDDNEIVEIFKLSLKEQHKANETIFKKGELGDKMYVIISGKMKLVQNDSNGAEKVVATRAEGECFGEMAIIDQSPRSASAITMEDTVVVAINEIVLRVTRPELCMKLYKNLASVLTDKLRESSKRIWELERGSRS